MFEVQNNRAIPEWGKEIFSDRCVLMRPNTHQSLDVFYRYAVALVRVHLKYAQLCGPVQHNRWVATLTSSYPYLHPPPLFPPPPSDAPNPSAPARGVGSNKKAVSVDHVCLLDPPSLPV